MADDLDKIKIVTFRLVLICLSIDANAQRIAHKMDKYLSEISGRNDFSGNGPVSLAGEVIFSKSYGFSANIMRFPEKNTCIIVLSNNQLTRSGAASRTISEILFLSK